MIHKIVNSFSFFYRYSIFDSATRRILPGYPKPIVKDWLGQAC